MKSDFMEKQIVNEIKNRIKKHFVTLSIIASLSLLPLKAQETELKPYKNLYFYSEISENLISRDPFWTYPIKNICGHQFGEYLNKKNEKVPLMFVAYSDGRAGFFILPSKSETEILYYEYSQKFEPRKDGVCHIFEGEDSLNGKKFIYFRVVDNKGETVNYGINEGQF